MLYVNSNNNFSVTKQGQWQAHTLLNLNQKIKKKNKSQNRFITLMSANKQKQPKCRSMTTSCPINTPTNNNDNHFSYSYLTKELQKTNNARIIQKGKNKMTKTKVRSYTYTNLNSNVITNTKSLKQIKLMKGNFQEFNQNVLQKEQINIKKQYSGLLNRFKPDREYNNQSSQKMQRKHTQSPKFISTEFKKKMQKQKKQHDIIIDIDIGDKLLKENQSQVQVSRISAVANKTNQASEEINKNNDKNDKNFTQKDRKHKHKNKQSEQQDQLQFQLQFQQQQQQRQLKILNQLKLTKHKQQSNIEKVDRNYDHLGRLIKRKVTSKDQRRFTFIPMQKQAKIEMQMQKQKELQLQLELNQCLNQNIKNTTAMMNNNNKQSLSKNAIKKNHQFLLGKSPDSKKVNFAQSSSINGKNVSAKDSSIHGTNQSPNFNSNLNESLFNYLTEMRILKQQSIMMQKQKGKQSQAQQNQNNSCLLRQNQHKFKKKSRKHKGNSPAKQYLVRLSIPQHKEQLMMSSNHSFFSETMKQSQSQKLINFKIKTRGEQLPPELMKLSKYKSLNQDDMSDNDNESYDELMQLAVNVNSNKNVMDKKVYFISSKLSYKFVSLFTIERILFRVQKVKENQQKQKTDKIYGQGEKNYIIQVSLKMYNQVVVQKIKYKRKNNECTTTKKIKAIILDKQEKTIQKEKIKSFLFSQLFVNKSYSYQKQKSNSNISNMQKNQCQFQYQYQFENKGKGKGGYFPLASQKFNPSSRVSLESNNFLQIQIKKDSIYKPLSGNIGQLKETNHQRFSSMSYNSISSQCYQKIVQYIEQFCTMEISYLGISLRQIQENSAPTFLKQIMKKRHSQAQQTLFQTFNLAKVFYYILKINKTFYIGKCVKVQKKIKYSLLYQFSNLVRHTKYCKIELQQPIDKSMDKLRADQLSRYLYERMIAKFQQHILDYNHPVSPLNVNDVKSNISNTNNLSKSMYQRVSNIKRQCLLDGLQICFGHLKEVRNSQCDDEMIFKIYQTNYKNQIKWRRNQYKFYNGINTNFFVYHGAFDFGFMNQRQKGTNILMRGQDVSSSNNKISYTNKKVDQRGMRNRSYRNINGEFSYSLTRKFQLSLNYEQSRNILIKIQDHFLKQQFLLLHLHKSYTSQYHCSQIQDKFLQKNMIKSIILKGKRYFQQKQQSIDSKRKINRQHLNIGQNQTLLGKNTNTNSNSNIRTNSTMNNSLDLTNILNSNNNNNEKTFFVKKNMLNCPKVQYHKQLYKAIDIHSNTIKIFIKDYDQENNKWLEEDFLQSVIKIKIYSRKSFKSYELSVKLENFFNHLQSFYKMKSNRKIYGKHIIKFQNARKNKCIQIKQLYQQLDFYVKRLKLIQKNAYSRYQFNFNYNGHSINKQQEKNKNKYCLQNSIDYTAQKQKGSKHATKSLNDENIVKIINKCLKKVFHGFFIIITLSKMQIFGILELKVYVNKVHRNFVFTIQQSISQTVSFQALANAFFNFLKNTYFKKILQKQYSKQSKKYKQFYSHMINEAQTSFISKTRKVKERGHNQKKKPRRRSQYTQADEVCFSQLTQEIISHVFHSKRQNKYLIRVAYLPNSSFISQRKGIDQSINVSIYRQNSMLIYKFVTNARRLLSKKFSKQHNINRLQYQEKSKPYYILLDQIIYLIQESNQTTYGLLAAFKRYFLDKNYNNLATNHLVSCFSIKMLAGLDFNKLFSSLSVPNENSTFSIKNQQNHRQQIESQQSYPYQKDYIFSNDEFNIRETNSQCYERFCIFVHKFQMIQVLKVKDFSKNEDQQVSARGKNYKSTKKKFNKKKNNLKSKYSSQSQQNNPITTLAKNLNKGILNLNNNKKKEAGPRHSIDFRLEQNRVFQQQSQQNLKSKQQQQNTNQNQNKVYSQLDQEKIVYLIDKETEMIKEITQWNEGGLLSNIPFKKYNRRMFQRLFQNLTFENEQIRQKQQNLQEEKEQGADN